MLFRNVRFSNDQKDSGPPVSSHRPPVQRDTSSSLEHLRGNPACLPYKLSASGVAFVDETLLNVAQDKADNEVRNTAEIASAWDSCAWLALETGGTP